MIQINFIKLNPKAQKPLRAKEGDAGYDLYSPFYFKLKPFERKVIPIGIAMEIPYGYYGKICDRSGHATKRGIHVMAGTIDAGFRDEIGVVLINLNGFDYLNHVLGCLAVANTGALANDKFFDSIGTWEVKEGEKIAQIIFRRFEEAELTEVDNLSCSERGLSGWGSSG